MYISRMILLVIFGVFMLPPMIAPLATRIPHGWLMPACLWALVVVSCFWVRRTEQTPHG